MTIFPMTAKNEKIAFVAPPASALTLGIMLGY